MTEKALLVKSCTSVDGRYYAVGLSSPHVRIFDTARGALAAHIDLAEKMASDKRAGLQSALNSSVASSYHDRAQELAAVRDITLTSVHMSAPSAVSQQMGSAVNKKIQKIDAVDESSQLAIAGFSNGTIIAVRVEDDTVMYHVAVSDTQQPVVGFASTSEFLFVLTANKQLHVLDSLTGVRRVVGIPVPANTTSVAVYSGEAHEAGRVDVLLCGTSTLFCSLHVPTHRNYAKMDALLPALGGSSAATTHAFIGSTLGNGRGATNIGITCAASEGVVRVWDLTIGGPMAGANVGARCRRILPCNHRVASMSVRPERGVVSVTTFAGQIMVWEFVNSDGQVNSESGSAAIISKAGDAYAQPANVAITSTCVPPPANAGYTYQRAQQAHRSVVRGIPTRKILDACLVPNPSASNGGAANAAASCNLVIVRGKYALPSFDGASLGPVFTANLLGIDHNEQQQTVGSSDPQHHLFLTVPGYTVNNSPIGPNLSFNPHEGVVSTNNKSNANSNNHLDFEDEEDEEAIVSQFELKIGAGWATHSADAHRALVTATEEFAQPKLHHAASMKTLPTGGLSAKEADKAMDRVLGKKKKLSSSNGKGEEEEAQDDDADDEDAENTTNKSGKKSSKNNKLKGDLGALGLAVIPLYQALHANDKSLVMELITLSSRSQADIVATVRKLELPYVLQLFHILSERLISLNQMDHPFHAWVAAILQARGVELMADENHRELTKMHCSTPKQFIAPLKNNYSNMLDLQDRLSVLFGRLSIFNAVRPRAKTIEKNSHATLRKGTIGADPTIFPNCFKEVLQRPKGKQRKQTVALAEASSVSHLEFNVVRVSSKVIAEGGMSSAKRSTAQIRADRKAARKAEAKRKRQLEEDLDDDADETAGAGKKPSNSADDVFDEADEDEMMDHLDDMNLDDSDDDGDDEEDFDMDGEEGEEEGSVILDGPEDEDGNADDSESSADEADNLLDSEDELAVDDEEDEEDEDEEDEDDDDDEGGDDSDDDVAGINLDDDNDDGDDDDLDSIDDVEEAIRHEHDQSHRSAGNEKERKKNRRMRTD